MRTPLPWLWLRKSRKLVLAQLPSTKDNAHLATLVGGLAMVVMLEIMLWVPEPRLYALYRAVAWSLERYMYTVNKPLIRT